MELASEDKLSQALVAERWLLRRVETVPTVTPIEVEAAWMSLDASAGFDLSRSIQVLKHVLVTTLSR